MSTHLTFLKMTTLFGQRPLLSPQTRKLKDSLLSARTFSLSRVSLQLGRKIFWINRSLLDRHLKTLGNLDLNVTVKRCKDIIVNNHFLVFLFDHILIIAMYCGETVTKAFVKNSKGFKMVQLAPNVCEL